MFNNHLFFHCLFLFIIFSGCSSPFSPPTTLFSGVQMTIAYHITVGSPLTQKQKNEIQSIIHETFDETNRIYNKWNPHSELSALNQLKAREKVALSSELHQLLLLTDKVVRVTQGRFDPTIEPLQQLWKKKLDKGSVPDAVELGLIKKRVGWDKIHLEEGFFWKENDLVALDLGGIAKGYCVDLLLERIVAAGFANVLVEWGGEMRAAGLHPEERPWQIYITHLEDTDPTHAVATIPLVNQAIATSGDYLQQWHVGETIYHHIFDPKATSPLVTTSTSICSVSVVAGTCAVADAIATAGMLFSTRQEAQEWAVGMQQEWPEASFWFMTREETN